MVIPSTSPQSTPAPRAAPSGAAISALVDGVARHGYAVTPAFLSAVTIEALRRRVLALDAAGGLAPAGVGRGHLRRRASEVRGDRIAWLDESAASPAESAARAAFETLRAAMNRELMMGLERFDAHYAIYPPGAHYARHLDRFRDDDARALSCVLYLNRAWRPEDGGALRLHLDALGARDVLPLGGVLVVFLAGHLEHEVLPGLRARASLAGWFSRRQC
ncbi:MAG TPA: 2OG-Fe(II) oxygenase [Casimicrobiaceae bacterium]|nr:2OG-Fe(II) oxygenase [Casimicrobiaceae bacterium]